MDSVIWAIGHGCMGVSALLKNAVLGAAPLAGQMNCEPAKAEPTEAMKWRTKATKNAAPKPLRVEACPLACEAEQVGATNGINLVQENLLKLVDGVRRRCEDADSPSACERRVSIKKQVGECLPDRLPMLKVFMRGFHGTRASRRMFKR